MFNARVVYTISLNMHRDRGDQTKHTRKLLSQKVYFSLAHFFPAAHRIKSVVVSWGTQGEGLVLGKAGCVVESDPVSSYALAI